MRKWVSAAVSGLPVFLLGCVLVLVACQFRLARLQDASLGHEQQQPHGATPRDAAAAAAAAAGLLQQQQPAADASAAAGAAHKHPPQHDVSGSSGGNLQQQAAASQAAVGAEDAPAAAAAAATITKDTLVLYIFSEADPLFKDNLAYFLLAGVQQDSRCDYVIIVQLRSLQTPGDQLPAIPHVQYLYYGGSCLEWGMLGWALQQTQRQPTEPSYLHDWQQRYKYFILLSSAVRGPFMPTYLDGHMHWTHALLSRLSARVKLVGPVVSCVPAPSDPADPTAAWATNPHIPFHALATDRAGLDVLMAAGVTGCHTSLWEEKYHSELRAASALMAAGYSIDCLLVRYQGVDWAHASASGCNRAWHPTGPGDFAYDGLSLDPMEVMFARVNSPMLEARVPSVLRALKYSQWALAVAAEAVGLSDNFTARVTDNAFVSNKGIYKLPRILTAFVRGRDCFDAAYYVEHNRDFFGKKPLSKYSTADLELAWKFFVYMGQFEDRRFRYTCPMNYTALAVPGF